MASAEPQCDICQLKHITKPAVVWCSECDEAICIDCNEHHSLMKATKNHKTIPIEDYNSLPQSVVAIQHHCVRHGEKFEFYCTSHTAPCCVKCVKEIHRQCNVDLLRDVVQGIKESAAFSELENSLWEIRDTYENINEDNSDQVEEIESQASSYKKDIRKFRQELNAYLDHLEQHIENELLNKKQDIQERITKITSEIDKKLTNSVKKLSNISQVKQHASNLQAFLTLKQIEKDVQDDMSYIENLRNNPSWKTFSLQLKMNPELKCFMQKVNLWGEVVVVTSERSINTCLTKNREAQRLLPSKTKSLDIDKINPEQKTAISVTGENKSINGCEVLPDGKLIPVLPEYTGMQEGQSMWKEKEAANILGKDNPPFYPQQVRPPQQQRMQMLQQQNVYPLAMYMPPSQPSGIMNNYGAPILVQPQPGQIQQMMIPQGQRMPSPQQTYKKSTPQNAGSYTRMPLRYKVQQDQRPPSGQVLVQTQQMVPVKREKIVLQIIDPNSGTDILSDMTSSRSFPPGSSSSGSRGQTPNENEKLEFTTTDGSTLTTPTVRMPIERMQDYLHELVVDKPVRNEEIFDWIEANLDDFTVKDKKFIRALMTAVCSSAITGRGNNAKVDPTKIIQRGVILQKYLDHQAEFELQALYALQALVHKLEHPPGVLRTLFDTLYDEDIISEDAFNQWEASKDPAEQEGKGVAMKQVVQFFTWLKEADDEPDS